MIRWLKRLFRKPPARQITPEEFLAAMERAQARLKAELEKSYFTPSPFVKSINVMRGDS